MDLTRQSEYITRKHHEQELYLFHDPEILTWEKTDKVGALKAAIRRRGLAARSVNMNVEKLVARGELTASVLPRTP